VRKCKLLILLACLMAFFLWGCAGNFGVHTRSSSLREKSSSAERKDKAIDPQLALTDQNLEKMRIVPVPIICYHVVDDNIFGLRGG
jgi:hypothetical protein